MGKVIYHISIKSMLRILLIFALPLISAIYDNSKIVDMKDYKKNYRTLDCWECFEAKGKMCHHKSQKSMMKETGSSNAGHGICCKPDYEGKLCKSDSKHECS